MRFLLTARRAVKSPRVLARSQARSQNWRSDFRLGAHRTQAITVRPCCSALGSALSFFVCFRASCTLTIRSRRPSRCGRENPAASRGRLNSSVMCTYRAVTFAVFSLACASCAHVPGLASQDMRAIKAAEAFVVANGYTSEPASLPFEQLTPELWDSLLSKEQVFARRLNYLEPHAIGFERNNDGWLVVFKVSEHAVTSRQDAFPFTPVGHYVPVTRQLQVGALMHAWADPNDPAITHIGSRP